MEERILLKTDVHEGSLQAIFKIANLALEDAADQAFLGGALDGEFLELADFHHRHARFQAFPH